MAVTDPATVAGLGGQAAPPDGGLSVAGVNSADGQAAVVDPAYVDPDPEVGERQRQRLANELRADESATEAERSSGERTVTGTGVADRVDGADVGLATAELYRKAGDVRALRMDRSFAAGGVDGEAGDWLVVDEHDGTRLAVAAADFDRDYRPV